MDNPTYPDRLKNPDQDRVYQLLGVDDEGFGHYWLDSEMLHSMVCRVNEQYEIVDRVNWSPTTALLSTSRSTICRDYPNSLRITWGKILLPTCPLTTLFLHYNRKRSRQMTKIHLYPESEQDIRLELEAAIATHNPNTDCIRNVAARIIWGSRTVKDHIGLMDNGTRILQLWHTQKKLQALRIDHETISFLTGEDKIEFGPYSREDIPGFIREHRYRFDWIHPEWRALPYPTTHEPP